MNLLNVMLMAGASGQQGNGGATGLLMIVLIIVIFYFFMIRPQSKRQKEEKKFREALQKGQSVVTVGGVHGKIKELKDTTVVVEVANEICVEFEKSSIQMLPNKTTAAEKK